eukprot:4498370-Heterocapsa_arctica.AAC.1
MSSALLTHAQPLLTGTFHDTPSLHTDLDAVDQLHCIVDPRLQDLLFDSPERARVVALCTELDL